MSHSNRLTIAQVRDLGRLIGDVRAITHDLVEQRRVLVDGACALLGADEGFFAQFADWQQGKNPVTVQTVPGSVVDPLVTRFTAEFYAEHAVAQDAMAKALFDATSGGPATTTVTWSDARDTYSSRQFPAFYEILRAMHFTDVIDPVVVDDQGNLIALSLHRLGKSRPFTPRQKKLCQLLAEELRWLKDTGRLNLQQVIKAPRLTPRLREVHGLLVSDLSSKEIAYRMKLSRHTVREYVARLYRIMGVNSRAEYLIRAMRGRQG